jgi:hypothetical protein
MATRSRIRMVLPSGEAKSIYCHWDGYPSHHAPILKGFYNTTEKVRELLQLGAISVLAPLVKPNEGDTHSFENRARNVVVAYHRDRGEELQLGHDDPEEYDYVWDGEKWNLCDGRSLTKL